MFHRYVLPGGGAAGPLPETRELIKRERQRNRKKKNWGSAARRASALGNLVKRA